MPLEQFGYQSVLVSNTLSTKTLKVPLDRAFYKSDRLPLNWTRGRKVNVGGEGGLLTRVRLESIEREAGRKAAPIPA